ncbi:MAG: terminase small subunit [Cetobacterium sp.]
MKLTPKQKAFADFYIQTGNATESAKKAGYKESNAAGIGCENLIKPHIKEYIDSRMKQIANSRIATAEEILEFYTSLLRNEENPLDSRLRSAENLAKRLGIATSIREQEAKVKNLELEIKKKELEIEKLKSNAGDTEDKIVSALEKLSEVLK